MGCTLIFTEAFSKWSLDIQVGKYFAKKTLLSAIFLCLPLFSGCNAEEPVNITPGSKKILIAVFSYTGNTRQAAQAIQRKTGGTLIEIEPETPYSKDYQAVVKQGREEVDSGFLPKLKTKAANIRDYDVIFVGSPIWWYTIAPPVASFLHDHDLSGKTVVPFFTHGGYGIGHSLKDIRKYAPGAVLAGEFVDHFFIFQKNSLHLKMANFSSLKRRSKFSFSKNSPGETGTSFCLKKEFEHRENGRKEIRTSGLYS